MSEKVSSTALKLNRLKHASAAYQEHKAMFTELEGTGVDPESGINEGDHMAEGFQTWPEFREAFLTDWTNNRRIVDEKEADVHFDTLADEALNELDSGAVTVDVEAVADAVEATEELEVASEEDAPALILEHEAEASAPVAEVPAAPKRRGRPPGSGKKAAVVKAEPKRRGRPPGAKAKTPKVKQAAAKKKGGNKAAQAREIIATWAAKGWARKDIIGKLKERLDLSDATASTYYQNYK